MSTHNVNMTSCQGSTASLRVPHAWVQDDLPPGFVASEPDPGFAFLQLESATCPKISINGRDEGSANYTMFSVLIDYPGNAEPPDGIPAHYLLETRTDHDLLSVWLRQLGANPLEGAVDHEVTPTGVGSYSDLETSVTAKGLMVYHLQATPTDRMLPRQYQIQFYYGNDPSRDAWLETKTLLVSGAGPGDLETAQNSKLAEVLEGQTRWVVPAVSAIQDVNRLIDPAETGERP